jgi:hypothetical protein
VHHLEEHLIGGCPNCRSGIRTRDVTDPDVILSFLANGGLPCWACGGAIDLWNIVLRHIKEGSPFLLFSVLHARESIFSFQITKDRITKVTLSDHGIPRDATILDLNLTPSGGELGALFPSLLTGNNPLKFKAQIQNEIHLAAVPLGTSVPDETTVNAFVAWLPNAPEVPVWESLVEAYKAFSAGHFEEVVLPANVALETKLQRLLLTGLKVSVPSLKVLKRFLQEAATYHYQLNVILPILCNLSGLPTLSDEIRGALNRLRQDRNSLVHRGQLERSFQQGEAAEALAAALIGFRYLDAVAERLLSKADPT